MVNIKKIKYLVLALSLSFLPSIVFGQFDSGFGNMASELSIELIPEYPRPNENVYLRLSLYTADLNSADIFWYKNDKLEASGKGLVTYQFRAGNVGEKTKIEILVRLLGGKSFSRVINFNPAGVDLVWEASSYTPPFYRGKALHSYQGFLKIVALPDFMKNNVRISPDKLIYEWSNDTETYLEQSGYGKSVLYLNGSILGRDEKINVLVKDIEGTLVASNSVTVSPVDPQIIFYENNPYYGYIFENALKKEVSMKDEEFQILAVPFYFSKERNGMLKYEWRLNGNKEDGLTNSRTAIFRKPENEAGFSTISVNIENTVRILQSASQNLTIKFNK